MEPLDGFKGRPKGTRPCFLFETHPFGGGGKSRARWLAFSDKERKKATGLLRTPLASTICRLPSSLNLARVFLVESDCLT